jgi:hypothetical protein
MDDRLQKLLAETTSPNEVWRPTVFDLSEGSDREELERLFAGGDVLAVHDTIEGQLRELASSRDPGKPVAPTEARARGRALAGGQPLHVYGRWVWYPWSRRVVHLLPESEFRELRSNRNRYKITPEEQQRLRSATIGFAGLSVGQVTAVTMALEGVGGRFRLADYDTLSLSNMNRIRAAAHDLGMNKAVIAARQMVEIDPYLELELFTGGLTEGNVDRFLGGERPLDLLVEECDDLVMKLLLRERAREMRMPVLMETNERGLIDIERFDLEPDRPILHGMLEDVTAKSLRFRKMSELLPLILRMVDGMHATNAAAASMMEIGHTISNFPQLASAVALGGALATDTARRILLGRLSVSGRFHVDLEAIVRDGGAEPVTLDPPLTVQMAPEALAEPSRVPRPRPAGEGVGREEVEFLVRHALLAPSGGNAQPWRFGWDGSSLRCFLRTEPSLLDLDDSGASASLGAAVYNIELAAHELGLEMRLEPVDDSGGEAPFCELRFTRGAPSPSPLFAQIPRRATHRAPGRRERLTLEDQAALHSAADEEGGRLELVSATEPLAELGRLIGACDRLRFLSRSFHEEAMREMRWTPAEALATRDGLDLAVLDLTPGDAAVLRVMARWPVMEEVRRIGGGASLESRAKKLIDGASAVGLLTVPGTSRLSYFRGGRPMQRVWLTATALGLTVQPQATLPYVLARLERAGGDGLDAPLRAAFLALRARYLDLFEIEEGRAGVLLFAVARTGPPPARSLRRKLKDVLAWAEPAAGAVEPRLSEVT